MGNGIVLGQHCILADIAVVIRHGPVAIDHIELMVLEEKHNDMSEIRHQGMVGWRRACPE